MTKTSAINVNVPTDLCVILSLEGGMACGR